MRNGFARNTFTWRPDEIRRIPFCQCRRRVRVLVPTKRCRLNNNFRPSPWCFIGIYCARDSAAVSVDNVLTVSRRSVRLCAQRNSIRLWLYIIRVRCTYNNRSIYKRTVCGRETLTVNHSRLTKINEPWRYDATVWKIDPTSNTVQHRTCVCTHAIRV